MGSLRSLRHPDNYLHPSDRAWLADERIQHAVSVMKDLFGSIDDRQRKRLEIKPLDSMTERERSQEKGRVIDMFEAILLSRKDFTLDDFRDVRAVILRHFAIFERRGENLFDKLSFM